MADLDSKTTRSLEVASRSVSRRNPVFTDLLRANIHNASAIVSELNRLTTTWNNTYRIVPLPSVTIGGRGLSIDQQIAVIQPDDLVTWGRVNREMTQRICQEIADLNAKVGLGIETGIDRLDTAETDIDTLETSLDTLEADIDVAEADIITLQSGKVAGISSSVDETLMRWDGTGGKTAQGSGIFLNDNDSLGAVLVQAAEPTNPVKGSMWLQNG